MTRCGFVAPCIGITVASEPVSAGVSQRTRAGTGWARWQSADCRKPLRREDVRVNSQSKGPACRDCQPLCAIATRRGRVHQCGTGPGHRDWTYQRVHRGSASHCPGGADGLSGLALAMDYLTHGLGLTGVMLAANRLAAGLFFAVSGYYKLFNRERHAALVKTLRNDGIPLVAVNQWLVPVVELIAGAAVAIGFFAPIGALLLVVICAVATCVDGLSRVRAWKPI